MTNLKNYRPLKEIEKTSDSEWKLSRRLQTFYNLKWMVLSISPHAGHNKCCCCWGTVAGWRRKLKRSCSLGQTPKLHHRERIGTNTSSSSSWIGIIAHFQQPRKLSLSYNLLTSSVERSSVLLLEMITSLGGLWSEIRGATLTLFIKFFLFFFHIFASWLTLLF